MSCRPVESLCRVAVSCRPVETLCVVSYVVSCRNTTSCRKSTRVETLRRRKSTRVETLRRVVGHLVSKHLIFGRKQNFFKFSVWDS